MSTTRDMVARILTEQTPEAYERAAITLARGIYQQAIAAGDAALSGSDLKGSAARISGASYHRSRTRLLARLREHGVPHFVAKHSRTMRVRLVYGHPHDEPEVYHLSGDTYLGSPLAWDASER